MRLEANTIELAEPIHGVLRRDALAKSSSLLPPLCGLDDTQAPTSDASLRVLAEWVRSYLMRPHPDLGRPGHVCPFTSQAARLSLLRIGVSPLSADQQAAILTTMQLALLAFESLPCSGSTQIFRTVIIGFPECADAAGIATLRGVQNAMRRHSIVGGKMIGLFEPDSQAEGLLNPDFRPLRSPVPALAIRMLVEQDAPFVKRNPLLVPIYLAKFPFAGTRRLFGRPLLQTMRSRLRFGFGRAKKSSQRS